MLSRDEFLKLRAPYIDKSNRRAERLMKQGKALEAAMVQLYNVIFEGLTYYAYLKVEREASNETQTDTKKKSQE